MPKILMLAMTYPEPAVSGHRVRIRALANVLKEQATLRLLVLSPTFEEDGERQTRAAFDAAIVVSEQTLLLQKAATQLPALLRGRQRWTERFRINAVKAEIAAEIEAFGPDIILIGHAALVSMVEPLGLDWSRVIVDHQNVESINYERMARDGTWLQRLGANLDARVFAKLERLSAKAAQQWAVSDVDRDALMKLTGKPVHTVPNVAPDSAFHLIPRGTKPGAELVFGFMGSYGYAPNRTALRELIAISEILGRTDSGAKIIALGGGAPAGLDAEAAAAGIVMPGFVADAHAYFERFTLLLAPLRSGSGTKLKVVEALAMGLPVVTTAIGAEGLPIEREGLGRVEESNEALAHAAMSLAGDRGALQEMSERARAWAHTHVSMEALRTVIAARLEAFDASRGPRTE
ncbi:MAG: glycosyltransferase family 4 protein [Pseudomonadota bacterium]